MNVTDIITLVGAASLVLVYWKQGGNRASSDVILVYKEQVSQLREEVANLTSKLGELAGILKEKNDRIKTLEEIFTNRDPKMESFMKTVGDSIANGQNLGVAAEQYMRTSSEDLHEIKNLLTNERTERRLDKKLEITKRK